MRPELALALFTFAAVFRLGWVAGRQALELDIKTRLKQQAITRLAAAAAAQPRAAATTHPHTYPLGEEEMT